MGTVPLTVFIVPKSPGVGGDSKSSKDIEDAIEQPVSKQTEAWDFKWKDRTLVHW
jgi:hypothetical protein